MDVEVWPDHDTAAAAGATHLAEWLREAVEARGVASLALSGGSTPRRMFEELAKIEVPWSAIHLFQVDERLAPDGHEARNLTSLGAHLLSHVTLPPSNLHPMPVGFPDPADALGEFDSALKEVGGSPPVLDAVHLGLGRDGHTASLFSGDPALEIDDADVATTAEHDGWRRLSLTVPTLTRARRLLWLVTGNDKAQALTSLLAGDDIPASLIDHPAAVVVADQAAAAGVVPD